ncbi:hypothetical protein G6O67_002793 [Ophiocordyceps sinensis]|uniref:DUF866 domain protein n=1 Tax=Ophiocordyceps sinensis TaxID=72228 RepID=A0A8H4V7N1_9HYPO|nr:hypothetical protein G6O67_002793 [Ophiocordyceps sinensis]
MTSSQLTASLDFLTDAAHLLRGAAPETSAHLMRHRADLVSHANVPQHELRQQHVCSACGHIMMPGQGGTRVKLETCKARQGRAAGTRKNASPPEKSVRRRKGTRPAAGQATTTATAKKTDLSDAPKKTANATSKQRAKNRKAGLQALLSQQQQQASASSLTLADFMRK